MAYGNTNKAGTGTFYHLLMNSDGELWIAENWTPSVQSDTTPNDSNKTFTVPASTEWEIQHIYVKLTSTGTVGNRQIELLILDNAAVLIGKFVAGVVQAASLARYYMFGFGLADLTAFRDTDVIQNPIPRLVLRPGYQIRVWDNKAVDAAADDMDVQILCRERTI